MTTTTEMETYDPSGGSQGVIVGQHVEQFIEFAKTLASSDLLPAGLKGKPANVFMALMQGLDLGLRPMQALNLIDVIQGKPAMSAQGMRAQILAAGHKFKILENTDTVCRIAAHRSEWPDDEWPEISFTIDQAKQAGLTGDNWKKYAADMLLARASTRMAKTYFPDVTNGMSSVEELLDVQPSRTLAEVAAGRDTPATEAPVEPDDDKVREAVLAAERAVAGDPPTEQEPEDAEIVEEIAQTKCEVCGGIDDHDLELHESAGIPPEQGTLT